MQQFNRSISLSRKIGLAIIVPSIIAVVTVSVIAFQREQESFREELQQQAIALLATLSEASDNALYLLDMDTIQLLTESMADTQVTDSVRFYDLDGRLVADSGHPNILTFETDADTLGLELLSADSTLFRWSETHLSAGQRIQLGNQRIGAVALELSTAPLEAKIVEARTGVIFVGTLVIAGTVALAALLNRAILNPLAKLTTAAGEVSEGRYDQAVQINTRDELQTLAQAFNSMTKAIQKRTQELETANTDLKKANQEVMLANQAKDEFLANVSHELRTPLNAIIGFSDMLILGMSGPLNEKQQHKIERMRGNGRRLLTLVNDILDLSRMQVGRFDIHAAEFAVKPMIERISQQMTALADQKAFQFEVRVDPSLPEKLVADEQRIEQVVVNLLSNAFKFTEKGSVQLNVSANHDDQQWVIAVKDTGVGIPPQSIELIFEAFRQADNSPTRQHQGSGLGLAITQRIVKMMDGTITVESKLDEGSTFTVTLPMIMPQSQQALEMKGGA